MNQTMPLFPLNLVAFPGEKLNLHIFEPRYQQLISDCLTAEIPFGIPSYVNNKIEYGTMVHIVDVHKVYDDGRMDIKTVGEAVIKIESFEHRAKGKKYATGLVSLIEDIDDPAPQKLELIAMIRQLYEKLKLEKELPQGLEIRTFNIAHKVGLSLQQEYQLLLIPEESKRVDFLIEHLTEFLPKVNHDQEVKERIRRNGHFKRLDKLNF